MANKPKPQKASPEGQSEVKGDKIQEKEAVELSVRRIFLVRHAERNYLLNVTRNKSTANIVQHFRPDVNDAISNKNTSAGKVFRKEVEKSLSSCIISSLIFVILHQCRGVVQLVLILLSGNEEFCENK
ncbi:hypothetical protein T4B_7969 [Trichinella pseudospiralis]|uniref:Uncharacterized protein n=1 Tax=Trichinella pseudospiralis TaxID=6337 RepID=A0A0V1IFN1_TRIPS|nr:hypothetical protein T4B_7969 [Trichinella pseudospiralis]KRZ41640.1 hypothetical protein T4C_9674 [Trichinella pseudospiralis]